MLRAARFGDGWLPYFYNPERYRDGVRTIRQLASEVGRDLSGFQWAFYPYISVYPTVDEAATVAGHHLGRQYQAGRDFSAIARDYCILGPVDRCVSRLQEYVDAGARCIIFSLVCSYEDRTRHIETISKEIIPGLRERVASRSPLNS